MIDLEINKKTLRNIFLGVAACIILYWILHETERFKVVFTTVKNVLSPFVIGSVLAFIINVPMRSIENMLGKIDNKIARRVIAVLLTFVLVALVLTLVFSLLIPQVTQTAKNVYDKLPGFATKVETSVTAFLNDNPSILKLVQENTNLQNLQLDTLIEKLVNMIGNSVSMIVGGAFSAIGSVASVIVNFVIGIVFALYCLFNKEVLARQGRKLLYAYLPEKWCDRIVRVLRLTNSTFSNFLSGQCIEVLILGSMFAVSMAIFRMPYIPLVSVLVAVTAFIPIVGAFVGCGLGALFILVDNPLQAVTFVIMFLVLQQIENNIIYPRVVGTSIGLPGMWVLLAVAVGGELMGVAGMFLMIPFASVIYALLRETTQKRLDKMEICQDKLEYQPPELRSHFKERRERARKKKFGKKQTNKQENHE